MMKLQLNQDQICDDRGNILVVCISAKPEEMLLALQSHYNEVDGVVKCHSVPSGWRKGEPLIVDKRKTKGTTAWFVKKAKGFRIGDSIPHDTIYEMWFYSTDELSEFLDWWG